MGTLGCLMATANSSASSFCRSASAAFLSCAPRGLSVYTQCADPPANVTSRYNIYLVRIGGSLLLAGGIVNVLFYCAHVPACMHSPHAVGARRGNTAVVQDPIEAHCWTLALLFLFLSPNVLSSAACSSGSRQGLVKRNTGCWHHMQEHAQRWDQSFRDARSHRQPHLLLLCDFCLVNRLSFRLWRHGSLRLRRYTLLCTCRSVAQIEYSDTRANIVFFRLGGCCWGPADALLLADL